VTNSGEDLNMHIYIEGRQCNFVEHRNLKRLAIRNTIVVRGRLSGSLAPQYKASSSCGWTGRLPDIRVAPSTMNKLSRTADKFWSYNLRAGQEGNNSPKISTC